MFNLVQCFKISHLSHTQKTLCISINHFTFTILYTHAYSSSCNSISNTLRKEKKKKQSQLPSTFQWHLHNSTLWYHLILTRMSRLWPTKGTCIFYSMTLAYSFDVKVRRCGFCEGSNSLWVFTCLGFWFGKVINVFCFRIREKEKETF